MFKWLGVFAMAVLQAPRGATAQSTPTYFTLSGHPDFNKYRPALVDYLRSQHYRKPTRFCLFGTKDRTGVTATVIWPAGQQIIDWGGNASALAESTSIVHLKADMVHTQDDLDGSTYLVTRKWAQEQQTVCKQHGETVWVSPTVESDAQLELALVHAMRPDTTKPMTRRGNAGAAIQGYIAAGYLANRPNARLDYSDYWWLKKEAHFMGHQLVMIEQEYMRTWVGCCVSPGVGVTVRVIGGTAGLEAFAHANRCSVDTHANPDDVASLAHVSRASLRGGRYAVMSCRERDMELQDEGPTIEPGSMQ